MVSRVSLINNPNQTISSIFRAPHLIDILKMKHHANPEHHHLPRGKLSQVNTTSFKTVGFDMGSCYHVNYKLLVIVGVSVMRNIFREPVVKTIKYINSNGWFRTYAININTEMYFHLKDEQSVFNDTVYVPTTGQFDDVKIA